MALMEQYGRPEDSAAYSVMALESGPFLTMVSLGVAGLSTFPWQTLVGAILPLAVGMLLGNLDAELGEFLTRAAPTLIPFFAFALGSTFDLHRVVQAGLLGLLLGITVVLLSAACLIVANRLTGGDGTPGMAAATAYCPVSRAPTTKTLRPPLAAPGTMPNTPPYLIPPGMNCSSVSAFT